jgi:hypothetical protein
VDRSRFLNMGFRLQRRIPLGKGLGVNVSGSGTSVSLRSRFGSLSPRGFSLRTGIPGLSYRSGFRTGRGRKGGADLLVMLLFALTLGVLASILWNIIRFVLWAAAELAKAIIRWMIRVRERSTGGSAPCL